LKTTSRFFLFGILIASVMAVPVFSRVQAQALPAPVIGIVDVQRVLRESKASKSVRPEIDRMRKAFQKQVSEQEQRLRQVEQELNRQRAILAPEAFAQKRRAFSEDARKAQSNVQQRRRDLDRAFNASKNEILENLVVVAQAVAESRKLNVLVEKRFVFLSAKTMDVTNDVIARLDKRLPKLKIDLSKIKQDAVKGKK
jgi:outer membrane protein